MSYPYTTELNPNLCKCILHIHVFPINNLKFEKKNKPSLTPYPKPFFPIFEIPVWLRNRSLSAGLEQVLSHSEKSCIASYYRQFSMNIKIKMALLIFKLLLYIIG